jgi:hypothetical protein
VVLLFSVSPLLRNIPILNNFDQDSAISLEAVAESCLIGAFDPNYFGKSLSNQDMEHIEQHY